MIYLVSEVKKGWRRGGGAEGSPIFRSGSILLNFDIIIGACVAEMFHKSPWYETCGTQSRKIT